MHVRALFFQNFERAHAARRRESFVFQQPSRLYVGDQRALIGGDETFLDPQFPHAGKNRGQHSARADGKNAAPGAIIFYSAPGAFGNGAVRPNERAVEIT